MAVSPEVVFDNFVSNIFTYLAEQAVSGGKRGEIRVKRISVIIQHSFHYHVARRLVTLFV